jgi:hypothetical protein
MMTTSDLDKQYPISFESKLIVQENDSCHEISLVSRKYSSIEGVSICLDGNEIASLTERDAYALFSLLKQFIEGKYERTEAY